MQNRVSFSNVSVGNMNKYITPNNNGGYSATGVTKNSTSNNIESIDLSSSNINSPTIDEIIKFGDMKQLFRSIMKYQIENLKLPEVDYCFDFKLADQNSYRDIFA